VLVNATDEPVSFTAAELAGVRLYLHRELRSSRDLVVRGASYDAATGMFMIPARTTAVFTDRR
jgi:pullulanase